MIFALQLTLVAWARVTATTIVSAKASSDASKETSEGQFLASMSNISTLSTTVGISVMILTTPIITGCMQSTEEEMAAPLRIHVILVNLTVMLTPIVLLDSNVSRDNKRKVYLE